LALNFQLDEVEIQICDINIEPASTVQGEAVSLDALPEIIDALSAK
jgi:hypothetical protein